MYEIRKDVKIGTMRQEEREREQERTKVKRRRESRVSERAE